MTIPVPQPIELASSTISEAQHQRAEALCREDPPAFREFVEAIGAHVCAFHLDHTGRVRYLSESAETVLDVRPADVLGMPWEEMVAWRSDAVLAGIEAERRIMERKSAVRLVHRYFTAEGEPRAVYVWASPILDETGTVTGIAGYLEGADYRLAVSTGRVELN